MSDVVNHLKPLPLTAASRTHIRALESTLQRIGLWGENLKLIVIVNIGRTRSGKSTSLNAQLTSLYKMLGFRFPTPDGVSGFVAAPNHEAITHGLWIWSVPIELPAPPGTAASSQLDTYRLVFIDCEGSYAESDAMTHALMCIAGSIASVEILKVGEKTVTNDDIKCLGSTTDARNRMDLNVELHVAGKLLSSDPKSHLYFSLKDVPYKTETDSYAKPPNGYTHPPEDAKSIRDGNDWAVTQKFLADKPGEAENSVRKLLQVSYQCHMACGRGPTEAELDYQKLARVTGVTADGKDDARGCTGTAAATWEVVKSGAESKSAPYQTRTDQFVGSLIGHIRSKPLGKRELALTEAKYPAVAMASAAGEVLLNGLRDAEVKWFGAEAKTNNLTAATTTRSSADLVQKITVLIAETVNQMREVERAAEAARVATVEAQRLARDAEERKQRIANAQARRSAYDAALAQARVQLTAAQSYHANGQLELAQNALRAYRDHMQQATAIQAAAAGA